MGFLRNIALACAAVLTPLLFEMPAHAEAPEYQVKAAMLYKFAVFVEWPTKAFATDTSPFLACVLGQDPFGKWLSEELGEAKVSSHPVEIRHLATGEAAGDCHLVFIGASEKPRLQQVMAPLRNTSALVVSDMGDLDEFCRLGGMIGLVKEQGKVRFELNSKALAKAGLKVDSRLMRVALSSECGEAK